MGLTGIKTGPRIILDIGTSTVNVLEANINPKKIKVTNVYKVTEVSKYFNNRDITNITGLVDTIVASFKENGVKCKNISLNFTSKSLMERLITIPISLNDKEIKNSVKLEFTNQFGRVSDETHVMDYAVYDQFNAEDQAYRTVLLACIPKVVVISMLKEFKKHGYKILDIDTDTSTLYYLSTLYKDDYIGGNKLIIDLGSSNVNIMILSGNSPAFIRSMIGGVSSIIRELKKEMDLPAPAIEEILRKTGVDRSNPPANIDNILGPLGLMEDEYFDTIDAVFYSELINEISKSVEYIGINMHIKIDKILLIGGGASIKGMDTVIENTLKTEVDTLEIVSSVLSDSYQLVNSSNKPIDSSFGISLGLAIKGVTK